MRTIPAFAVLILATFAAAAGEIDRLVDGLASGNEAAMAEARQMLPRQPVQAVSKLMPLVDHEDRRIAAAATRVLEDFIGVVTRPGHEDGQRFVTRQLMTLVSPEASGRARDTGFRLIPLVAPEDHDLAPLAAWLHDPDAREAARAGLELAGTLPARNALREALRGADADFQVALLNSLAQFDDPRNIHAVSSHLLSPEPEVRVAATRVLARSGGLDQASAIRRVMLEEDGGHHREAAESYAVLAERILLAGGNWDRGIAMFMEILEESPDPVAKGIALAGLGRFGDERAVPVILAAVEGDGGEALEPQAVAALQDLDGEGVRARLLAAHDGLSASMQLRMLDVYARKHDRRFLDIILAGAQAGDRESQRIAMSALAASGFPEAVNALVTMTETDDEDFRYEVLRVLENTAAEMEARGETEAAGRAYLAVYQKTDLPVVRRFALAGIKRCPVPEAYEVLLAEIDTGDIHALPVDLLTGLTRALYDQGRTEEAEDTLDALLTRATRGPHEVDAVINALHDAPVEGDLRHRLGLITQWHIIGPFDWNMDDAFTENPVNAPDIDLGATYTGKNGEEVAWKQVETPSAHGFVDLVAVLGAHEHCSAYAFATVTMDEETQGRIRAGSDDGIKVWVNGEAVLEHNVDRGMALDQDNAPVTLREGENEFVVQVTQNLLGWGFVVRLTDNDGVPLSFDAK